MSALTEVDALLLQTNTDIQMLRQRFAARAWDVVRAATPADERAVVLHLRELAQAVSVLQARQEALQKQRKALGGKGLNLAACGEGRRTHADVKEQAEAEIKRKRLEAEAAIYAARLERGRLASAKAKRLEAEREAEELACLAAEQKRDKIIQRALAAGHLQPVVETRHERITNHQRRSNAGIVRIESGDGR